MFHVFLPLSERTRGGGQPRERRQSLPGRRGHRVTGKIRAVLCDEAKVGAGRGDETEEAAGLIPEYHVLSAGIRGPNGENTGES